jgi:hypothetical protein
VYNPVGIAPYVDRIRIMAYDYSWSIPGPTAPLDWTQTIVDYVAKYLPPSKVELGVPLYGRDWITAVEGTCPAGVRTSGRVGLRTERAIALALEKGATPERQPNAEMMFSYTGTYTGPPPAEPPPTTTDPGDGFDPAQVILPTGSAGRAFVPHTLTPVRAPAPALVPADDEIIWPFPQDDGDPPPGTTDPPSTTAPHGGGGGGGDGPPGTTVPGPPDSTDPPPTTDPNTTVTCTVTRTVWYPDAGTTLAKAQQATDKGLAGIVFFAIGYEEPNHFVPVRDVAMKVVHAKGVDPIGEFDIDPGSPGHFSVKGWALDPEASLPIVVRITVDGAIRKQLLANGEVPELGTKYPGNGPFHGVDTELTTQAGRHRVCVQAIGLGAGTTVRMVSCKTVTVSDNN